MAGRFIGRKLELKTFKAFFEGSDKRIAVVYGRRRIGKTKLIEVALAFTAAKKLIFEGLENEPQKTQILNFIFQLEQQTNQRIARKSEIKTWSEALILLNDFLQKNPGTVVVLDELQWMANGRTRLVSELKMIWERFLEKHPGSKLILAGSIASFMVKRVVRSQAFYGRIDTSIHLKPLQLNEVREFLATRGKDEVELAFLLSGGVPKYIEILENHPSILHGIAHECFSESGYFKDEFERIFVSHFGRSKRYHAILIALEGKHFGLSRAELEMLANSNGGGQLTEELYNLEQAGFIHSFVPFDKSQNSKFKRYLLHDNFISFYLTFMEPSASNVRETPESFKATTFFSPKFIYWLGHAFEQLMLAHKDRLAEILGFSAVRYSAGPYYRHAKGGMLKGVQLDLVFSRADKVFTVCEAKYTKAPVPLSVGKELDDKITQIDALKNKTVQRVIFSNQAASVDLKNSGFIGTWIGTEDV